MLKNCFKIDFVLSIGDQMYESEDDQTKEKLLQIFDEKSCWELHYFKEWFWNWIIHKLIYNEQENIQKLLKNQDHK